MPYTHVRSAAERVQLVDLFCRCRDRKAIVYKEVLKGLSGSILRCKPRAVPAPPACTIDPLHALAVQHPAVHCRTPYHSTPWYPIVPHGSL